MDKLQYIKQEYNHILIKKEPKEYERM